MRSFLLTLLILACVYSCENNSVDCENYNYDCNTQEPYEWEMMIKVTINSENSQIPIWVYEGKFDDTTHLVYTDTLTDPFTTVFLPLNKYYYTKALYKKGSKTIYAIDGVFFKKYSRTVCDSTCWYIKNEIMDVRLK